ncbi:hypothetical protein AMTR_s00174p00039060 [Amborella trichopoda]|uniref:Aminotransferase-like plant mobile domain-containing protein n=1 Tax=Amborella trichopoda TaxID=13333 RepID=U5CWG4_AMBTC|nr:hypothetical protein AMTR_s00174p00039060 [Amborella trichopoda]
MTPTLFDVYEILGLAVDDDLVTYRSISDLRQFIEDNLDIVPTNGNLIVIKHSWLKANFHILPPELLDIHEPTFFTSSVSPFSQIHRLHSYQKGTYNYLKILRKTIYVLGVLQPLHIFIVPLEKLVLSSKDILVVQLLLCMGQAFETAMCLTTLIFGDITEPYIPDRVCRQFGVKYGMPRNPIYVGKRSSRQGGQRDWKNVNSDKIHQSLTWHERMMPVIKVDIANGLPSEEYKAWYSRVSHLIIHNVANPRKDILQLVNHEEEEVVPTYESQYIMRLRCYEDQLVSAVQANTIMLVDALILRQKLYLEVYNWVNNAFEMMFKFVPVDMDDIEARMETL